MSLDPTDGTVTALVTDFNTSRVAAHKGSQLTPNIGTLQWYLKPMRKLSSLLLKEAFRRSAPEVLRGEDNTTMSDVYSFGIILFEILTRGSPYPKLKFTYAIMDKVLQGMRPEIPQDCPLLYAKVTYSSLHLHLNLNLYFFFSSFRFFFLL